MAALLVAILALPVTGGLSFSESVTAFITGDGVIEAIKQSSFFATSSPLYYILVALFTDIFGNDELALRGVSIAASILMLATLYSLVSTLTSRMAALLCFTILTFSGSFLALTFTAEPFSLGLMFLLISLRFWIVFLRKRSIVIVVGHFIAVFLAILSSYAVLVPLLASHIVLWFIWPVVQRPRWRIALFYLSCIVVPISPALMHIVELHSRAELKATGGVGNLFTLWDLIPLTITALLLGLGVGIKRKNSEHVQEHEGDRRALLALGLTWWIVVTGVGFFNSPVFSHGASIFAIGFVGLTIAATAVVAGSPDFFRLTAVAAVFSLGVSLFAQQPRESWKEAAAILSKNSAKTILILTGAREAENARFYQRKDAGKYLSAPFLYYAVPQLVIPAGMTNFAESVEKETFDGVIVYASSRPLPLDANWLPHTEISTQFSNPKLIRFLQRE